MRFQYGAQSLAIFSTVLFYTLVLDSVSEESVHHHLFYTMCQALFSTQGSKMLGMTQFNRSLVKKKNQVQRELND